MTSRAVRQYHATGLLPEPARDDAGHRTYGPGDLELLLRIGRLRAEGRTLDEIGALLTAEASRRSHQRGTQSSNSSGTS